MNRRQLMILPAAAVAASPGFAQSSSSPSTAGQQISSKTLLKYIGSKSSYKIPKSDAKKTKYLNSLTALLALSSDQQQQATALFTDALAARTTARDNLKAARKSLREAVKNNDRAGIEQMSATIGSLRAQVIGAGANANAAFQQMLAPDQQAKLAQFKS